MTARVTAPPARFKWACIPWETPAYCSEHGSFTLTHLSNPYLGLGDEVDCPKCGEEDAL